MAEYVSFSNPASADPQFQTEKFYRLKENAPVGENPETHPAHWAYQGSTIGEITIDDVVGLREELDWLREDGGGTSTAIETSFDNSENDFEAENVQAAIEEVKEIAESNMGTSQERFSLIGHTSIPTAFSAATSIVSVPKFTNLTSVKLVNSDDDSEIEIVTDSVVADLPIAVAAGDYTYELAYESGYEQGVLLINFSA